MLVSFDRVSLTFGGKKIFHDTTLDIGESCCLTGASGCGKTTFMRLAAGLLKPDSGAVYTSFKKPAVMFQEDRLLPWFSAKKNIMAAARTSEKDALKWLYEVGLLNDADSLPSELSGGMARRVALARTLAFGGDMLLLDEPFKGLDPELAKRMISLVLDTGLPFIVATHSASETERLKGGIITLGGMPSIE